MTLRRSQTSSFENRTPSPKTLRVLTETPQECSASQNLYKTTPESRTREINDETPISLSQTHFQKLKMAPLDMNNLEAIVGESQSAKCNVEPACSPISPNLDTNTDGWLHLSEDEEPRYDKINCTFTRLGDFTPLLFSVWRPLFGLGDLSFLDT